MNTIIEIEAIDAGGDSLEESVAAPLADWASLSKFEVRVLARTKITARVYANGLQQVPVEILVEGLDKNGVVVQLSAAQLKTIKLIDYDTEADITGVSHDSDARYVYHWDPTQGDVPAAEAEREQGDLSGAQSIFLYVNKTAVTTHKVAAEIKSPSNVVFRTNTANPTPGKFDSWVNIQGVERVRYDHTDLALDRVDEASNSYGDVDLYYIRFKEQGLNIVHSVHLDVAADTIHVHQRYGGMYRGHYAYGVGAVRKIWVGYNGVTYLTWEINKRPGQATAARVSMNGLRLTDSLFRREACLRYYNQHGNYVECALGNSYTDDFNLVHLESNVHS